MMQAEEEIKTGLFNPGSDPISTVGHNTLRPWSSECARSARAPHWKNRPISWQAGGLNRFLGIDHYWIEATQ